MDEKTKKVIVALDQVDLEKAIAFVNEVEDLIEWFKVGPALFMSAGLQIIEYLHKKKKNIFLDLKLHDIPNVVAKTVREVGDLGVRFMTVHCMGGKKMLEAAAASCRESKISLLGVTLLTSHEPEGLEALGWKDPEGDIVMRLLQIAMESRLSGIICSPQEIKRAREKATPGFLLVTPGIRLPKKEVYQDDQRRVASPKEALQWGADYIVVGRPITEAREPREAIKYLFNS